MALTPRKKIVAAIIALSAVFMGVSLLPSLADNENNNNQSPDITAPVLPAPSKKITPQPVPVDAQVPDSSATEAAAPVTNNQPAPDEPAAVLAVRTLRVDAANTDPSIRLAAAQKLDVIIKAHPRLSGQIMPLAGKLLKDNDLGVRAAALDLVKSMGMTYGTNGLVAVNLIGMLAVNPAQPPALRAAAATHLGDIAIAQKMHASAAVQKLINITADTDTGVRHAAIRALGRIGTAYNQNLGYSAANNIGTYLNDNDAAVRNEARDWARKICGANPALNCPRIP